MMEYPLPLRLPKEEQDVSDELLERLASSTHSPKCRFLAENDNIIQQENMETTKTDSAMKLILPFPHFLWMLGNRPDNHRKRMILHESQTGQENIIQINTGIISGNNNNTDDCQ